jgi:hypothetical protein
MTEIIVAPWGTRRELPNDPSAPMHTALWHVATEQAVIARMKKTGEDWTTAAKQVNDQEIIEQLDVVCDDNGFQRIDGTGTGRNPHQIADGEAIRVRIDPKSLTQPVKGIDENSPLARAAYNNQVGPNNGGVKYHEKQALDLFLGKIPGFETLPDGTKAAVIQKYGHDRFNPTPVATLAGSELFKKLNPDEQVRLLATYRVADPRDPNDHTVTTEIDKLATAPVNDENIVKLRVLSTPGFGTMNNHQQTQFLKRLTEDTQFRAGVSTIIGQANFTDKQPGAQGQALDILCGYSGYNKTGYIKIDPKNRVAVLVALYNDVLAKPDFKLKQPLASFGDQLSLQQSNDIKRFAEQTAPNIRA